MGEAELQLEAIRAAWGKVASEYPSVRGAGIWKPLREAINGPDPDPGPKWSHSRAKALALLRARETCLRAGKTDTELGAVNYQAADWLIANGFAELAGHDTVRITPAGQSVRVNRFERRRP